jgi:NAD(P)-dependent dehydrogenase (short-subunit alcohol dehydrogenase family)
VSRDVHKQTVLITGVTGAIGAAAAQALAATGARVVMLAWNASKAAALRNRILAETGNQQVEILRADLGDFDSLREAVATRTGPKRTCHILKRVQNYHILKLLNE